jgi:PPE-repeat protein
VDVKVWKILSLLSIAIFVLSATNLVRAASTLSPTSTISSVSGTLTYDSGKGELFVQDASGKISVVSDSTNKVTATVDPGVGYGAAHELAMTSAKARYSPATQSFQTAQTR